MRIAIANDLLIAVEALRRVLITVPDYEIAWIARDGAEAITKCAQDVPDLILMDLIMPGVDGVEATRQIMRQSPCAILVVTATVSGNAAKVFEAMGYGALDAVNTPILGTQGNTEGGASLLAKIATIAKLIGKKTPKTPAKLISTSTKAPSLLVIGSSTGGPQALAKLLSGLPENFRASVVIVQHVDVQFAPALAEWLDRQTGLKVQLAPRGAVLQPGQVFLAGTNDHLVMRSDLSLDYTRQPLDYPYRPSVDTFFKSVAEYYPQPGVGVLLTGMGRDGAAGLGLLRSQGWYTIAQDQATCVIYGMPKAAVELDAAVEVLPLSAIAPACLQHIPHSTFG